MSRKTFMFSFIFPIITLFLVVKGNTATFQSPFLENKEKFVNHMYNFIESKIGEKVKTNDLKKKKIELCFSLVYDHFATPSRESEIYVFLTHALDNTKFLDFLLYEPGPNEQTYRGPIDYVSRGLLRITTYANYARANKYSGHTNFVMKPKDMSFLTEDSIKATLYYWDEIAEDIRHSGHSVDYEHTLEYLDLGKLRTQIKGDVYPEYFKRISMRNELYAEIKKYMEVN